ncbi:OTU domain-containing protein 5-A-like [Rhopilema esculentum]|uniref:OTU domain-containing protein 5-A-like n=1 Tax=Rhopilema esculentum TaxID=499914 RepID=UPI0031DF3D74
MTILPKKKAQDGKASDPDFEEGRSRSSRIRTNRERSRPSSSEVSVSADCSATASINASTSRFEYSSELEKLESIDCSSVPYKRTRHRPAGSSSGKLTMSGSEAGRGTRGRHSDNNDNEEGYNSSDEHGASEADPDIAKKEEIFERELKERRGFVIKKMVPDGACLFRAVADQVYGDQEMHSIVRNHCMDYMMKNADYFSKFVTEDFNSYICRKKNDYCHGNNVEMQALSEMYNRPIEVFVYSTEPMNTFFCQSHVSTDENPPIRLSYHGRVHYNSIIDPYAPAVGVGLGLAGYKPGITDRMLLNSVIRSTENQALEEAMLEDKLKATDWETTDETMTEIVARESYLQWLKENQRKHRSQAASAESSSASSSQSRRSPPHDQPSPRPCASGYSPRSPRSSKPTSPRQHSPGSSPKRPDEQSANNRCSPARKQEVENCVGATGWSGSYPPNHDFNEWDDDQIIAAVLAKSQKEYYEQLSNSGGHRNSDKS